MIYSILYPKAICITTPLIAVSVPRIKAWACWVHNWRMEPRLCLNGLVIIIWKQTQTCSNELCYPGGIYSISWRTSYRKISWSLGTGKFGFRPFRSLWNLMGTSAAVLSRCLSNFRAMRWLQHPISRLRARRLTAWWNESLMIRFHQGVFTVSAFLWYAWKSLHLIASYLCGVCTENRCSWCVLW